jgi:hypothetical protein
MSRFTGDLRVTRGPDGTPTIEVADPGPLRVSVMVIGRRWAWLEDGIVTFLGVDTSGEAVELRYRVVGVESGGENGAGWLLTEPVA